MLKITDHCSKYALSDPKERPFSFACDRAHDQCCLQCEELKDVIQRIERYILECNLGREELDNIVYSFRETLSSCAFEFFSLCSRK